MRVLCFCEKWESGGIEAFITSVLECMDRTGLDIDLVACTVKPTVYDERLANAGIVPHALGEDLHATGDNLRAFKELLARENYDVVHLNLYEGLALRFAQAAKRAGVSKVIVHSHNNEIRPSATRWAKLIVHHICIARYGKAADERWAPSATCAKFLFGNRLWTLVRNGIDPEAFAYAPDVRTTVRQELGISDDTLVLGCVGRLCAQKNQTFLLNVLEHIDNAVLLLVGEEDGTAITGAQIRDLAARNGLEGRVILYGLTDSISRLYQAMDALCMPSLFEGLGIAAVEGQAAGLPVFASPAVPEEARICDLFETLPLNAAVWAEDISAVDPAARTSMTETVRATGYDIHDVACFIHNAYTGEDDVR